MKNATLLISVPLLLIGLPGRALDLSPRFAQSPNVRRPYFVDGKARYLIHLPPGTTLTGADGQARFDFEETDGATLVMKVSPLNPSLSFDEEKALEAYRKAALEFKPVGATEAAIVQEIPDPLASKSWSSYRFLVALKLPGKVLRQEITFFNFNSREQIVQITTAPEASFEQARALSAQIIQSWQYVKPEVDMTAPVYP